MISIKPGKQRRYMYNAPLHKKRRWISSHLEESLLLKYDRRSIPVVVGDTVRVMRGSFKGHEDKITRVDTKGGYVEVEGLTMTKADGKKIPRPIHPSNLLITKLNLTDPWRREKLSKKLSEDKKKEIETEAAEQIKLIEEKKKREEEERRLEEEKTKEAESSKEPVGQVEPSEPVSVSQKDKASSSKAEIAEDKEIVDKKKTRLDEARGRKTKTKKNESGKLSRTKKTKKKREGE
ncbi:MAG: 50S ribosomal protein L24 [Candidatus Thermoplasmatota archaeon]